MVASVLSYISVQLSSAGQHTVCPVTLWSGLRFLNSLRLVVYDSLWSRTGYHIVTVIWDHISYWSVGFSWIYRLHYSQVMSLSDCFTCNYTRLYPLCHFIHITDEYWSENVKRFVLIFCGSTKSNPYDGATVTASSGFYFERKLNAELTWQRRRRTSIFDKVVMTPDRRRLLQVN